MIVPGGCGAGRPWVVDFAAWFGRLFNVVERPRKMLVDPGAY
jgi:hypothetical protein